MMSRLFLATVLVGMLSCIFQTASANTYSTLSETSPNISPTQSTLGVAAPNMFTGAFGYSIPIEVPPGRNGLEPQITLTYNSGAGNGPLGVGWNLELGSIQRKTKDGVNYTGDQYVLNLGSDQVDLVRLSSGEYRAKIEGAFLRFRQLTTTDGYPYWEVTDKRGKRFIFGLALKGSEPNGTYLSFLG